MTESDNRLLSLYAIEDSGKLSSYTHAVAANIYGMFQQGLIDVATTYTQLMDLYKRNPTYPEPMWG